MKIEFKEYCEYDDYIIYVKHVIVKTNDTTDIYFDSDFALCMPQLQNSLTRVGEWMFCHGKTEFQRDVVEAAFFLITACSDPKVVLQGRMNIWSFLIDSGIVVLKDKKMKENA